MRNHIQHIYFILYVFLCVGQAFGQQVDSYTAQYREGLKIYENREDAYNEIYRQQFHFSPYNIWLNDPNGLAYFDNTWHLFYQHYLPQDQGGVSWGHATSKDLVHWEHKVPALFEDNLGAIFSGSGVVDHNNTSGLFSDNDAKYVGVFTYNKDYGPSEGAWQSQALAYSKDGKIFEKLKDNPVIADLRNAESPRNLRDFRDPKVFWYEPTKRWIMIVAGGPAHIYSSPDLKNWTFESWSDKHRMECPDLFPLAVDGDENNKVWVLSHAGRSYQLGTFDGHKFTPTTTDPIPMNFGRDAYASQSWDNAPNKRRVMISWMHSMNYSGEWPGRSGHGMSLPLELSLRTTDEGVRLFQNPVKELNKLRSQAILKENIKVEGEQVLSEINSRTLEVESTWSVENMKDSGNFGFELLKAADGTSVKVGYDLQKKEIYLDRTKGMWDKVSPMSEIFKAPLQPVNGKIKLRFFLDRGSLELFANDGQVVITAAVLAQPGANGVSLFSNEGAVQLDEMKAYSLESIWPTVRSRNKPDIHVWSSMRVQVGKDRWLSANSWPKSKGKLTYTSSDPSIAMVRPTSDQNWVKISGLKTGNATITVRNEEGQSGTSIIYVVEDSLITNANYMWEDGKWITDKSGLTHLLKEQHSVLSDRHGAKMLHEADITLHEKTAKAGLFIRSGGKGKFGYFIRLEPEKKAVTLGRWSGEPMHSKSFKVQVGKTYRLQVYEDGDKAPGKLVIKVNGKKVLSIPQLDSPKWARRMGIVAEGKATIQNIHVETFE